METKGSFNRLEWLLGILLIILLIVVVVLSLVFWFRPDAPGGSLGNGRLPNNTATTVAQNARQIAPTPIFEGQTAKVAYEKANDLAQNWHSDARLLSATATWPQGTPVEDLLTGKITWAFVFYSSNASKITTITVADSQTRYIGEADSSRAYNVQDITGWRFDSNQAIQTLLDQGGYNFINQENITVLTMALTTHDQTPSRQMEWLISLIGTESGKSIDLRLNATTGEILEISNAQ